MQQHNISPIMSVAVLQMAELPAYCGQCGELSTAIIAHVHVDATVCATTLCMEHARGALAQMAADRDAQAQAEARAPDVKAEYALLLERIAQLDRERLGNG